MHSPKNYHRLNHHRCAAEYLDICSDKKVDHLHQCGADLILDLRNGTYNTVEQTYQKSDKCSDNGNEHRIADTAEYLGVVFYPYSRYIVKKMTL